MVRGIVPLAVGSRLRRRRSTKTTLTEAEQAEMMAAVQRRHRSSSDSRVLRPLLLVPGGKTRDDELYGDENCTTENNVMMATSDGLIEIDITVRNILQKCLVHQPERRLYGLLYDNETDNEAKWRLLSISAPVERSSGELRLFSRLPYRHVFERTQLVKLVVANFREQTSSSSGSPPTGASSPADEDVLGACIFKVDELIGSFGLRLKKTLSPTCSISGVLGQPAQRVPFRGAVLISAQLPDRPQPILVQFAGRDLEKKELFFDESAVFFRVYRVEDDDERTLLYESESLRTHSRPVWAQFSLRTQQIADNRNRLLEVWVLYRDVDGQEGVIGRFLTTYAKMKYGVGPDNVYNVVNETKAHKKGYENSGRFELVRFTDVSFYSFLDYIVSGTQLHFSIAVDFSERPTASNGTGTNNNNTGSGADPSGLSFDADVMRAIRAIGSILRDYTPNRLFPAFGFGARLGGIGTEPVESQHFNLNLSLGGSSGDALCRGLDGLVEAFRTARGAVKPAARCCLAPTINALTELALQSGPAGLHYHVLVVLVRRRAGVVDDLRETRTALMRAANAPLSVVFLALPGADVDALRKTIGQSANSSATTGGLSGGKPVRHYSLRGRLSSSTKKLALPRDSVEVVDYAECIDSGVSAGANRRRLAEQCLRSLPTQLCAHMHAHNLAAKPPIQACRSPLFHSSFLIPDRPTEFFDWDEADRSLLSVDYAQRADRRGSDSNCYDNKSGERVRVSLAGAVALGCSFAYRQNRTGGAFLSGGSPNGSGKIYNYQQAIGAHLGGALSPRGCERSRSVLQPTRRDWQLQHQQQRRAQAAGAANDGMPITTGTGGSGSPKQPASDTASPPSGVQNPSPFLARNSPARRASALPAPLRRPSPPAYTGRAAGCGSPKQSPPSSGKSLVGSPAKHPHHHLINNNNNNNNAYNNGGAYFGSGVPTSTAQQHQSPLVGTPPSDSESSRRRRGSSSPSPTRLYRLHEPAGARHMHHPHASQDGGVAQQQATEQQRLAQLHQQLQDDEQLQLLTPPSLLLAP